MSEKISVPDNGKPSFYKKANKRYPGGFQCGRTTWETTLRKAGPIDEKTSHLIQLAASAASKSEGRLFPYA